MGHRIDKTTMKTGVLFYVTIVCCISASVVCARNSQFKHLPVFPGFLNRPLSTSPHFDLQNLYRTVDKRFNMDNRAFGEDDRFNHFMDWRTLFGKRSFGGPDKIGFHNMESPFKSYYQNWRERFFPKKKGANK
uniref:Uncharacterized protein n=2 Tax=Magallana gigas TaxID=29159 RepID=A0A8W8MC44_MAGGI